MSAGAQFQRKRRTDLTRDEFVAVGDWHIRQAEHLEEHRADDPVAAADAKRHRRRADTMYDNAAALGHRDGR